MNNETAIKPELVSVIMPVINEAENIVTAIDAVRRDYAPDEVEIVVADGGSTDGTAAFVPPDVTLVPTPRGRGVQMNRGVEQSHGAYLVFCHADSQLPAGWREAVLEALATPEVSGGTFQTLILPAWGLLKLRNRWVFRPRWQIMFGDQVQFMRRAIFEEVGGFEEIPLMEDVAMSRALHEVGRLVRIRPDLRVITSSRRFREKGLLRQSLENGLRLFRYIRLGADPARLARSYRSSREKEWETT